MELPKNWMLNGSVRLPVPEKREQIELSPLQEPVGVCGKLLPSIQKARQIKQRRRSNFTKRTKETLLVWLENHLDNPYPTEQDKQQLAMETSLSVAQVNNWFVNARLVFLRARKNRI